MASNVEKLAKRIQNDKDDMQKRREVTDQLQSEIDELDKQLDLAIDNEDLSAIEKLTRQRSDMTIKLEARKAVDARKAEKCVVSQEEVIKAWNEDCKDIQKRVSAAENELIQALINAAQKTKKMAEIAVEGYSARQIALSMAGVNNNNDINFNFPRYDSRLFKLDYLRKVEQVKNTYPKLGEFITQNHGIVALNWMNAYQIKINV